MNKRDLVNAIQNGLFLPRRKTKSISMVFWDSKRSQTLYFKRKFTFIMNTLLTFFEALLKNTGTDTFLFRRTCRIGEHLSVLSFFFINF